MSACWSLLIFLSGNPLLYKPDLDGCCEQCGLIAAALPPAASVVGGLAVAGDFEGLAALPLVPLALGLGVSVVISRVRPVLTHRVRFSLFDYCSALITMIWGSGGACSSTCGSARRASSAGVEFLGWYTLS